jgi:hypothetical protein
VISRSNREEFPSVAASASNSRRSSSVKPDEEFSEATWMLPDKDWLLCAPMIAATSTHLQDSRGTLYATAAILWIFKGVRLV